jgi:hypothetical protein
MRSLYLGAAAATSLLGASFAVGGAQAAPEGHLIVAVDRPSDTLALDPVQFIIGSQNYCWYEGGWQGPGFYWCGYAWRRGYGWGGGYGWRGWGGGYANGWRGGPGGYASGGRGAYANGGRGGYANGGVRGNQAAYRGGARVSGVRAGGGAQQRTAGHATARVASRGGGGHAAGRAGGGERKPG